MIYLDKTIIMIKILNIYYKLQITNQNQNLSLQPQKPAVMFCWTSYLAAKNNKAIIKQTLSKTGIEIPSERFSWFHEKLIKL